MSKKANSHQGTARLVILSVSGGVADVILKPKGMAVTIFDYDVEGSGGDDPRISKDPDGHECHISEWPSGEKVTANKHWPIVTQAIHSIEQPYSRQWQCPDCGRVIECSYENLAKIGTPYCADCESEMDLI